MCSPYAHAEFLNSTYIYIRYTHPVWVVRVSRRVQHEKIWLKELLHLSHSHQRQILSSTIKRSRRQVATPARMRYWDILGKDVQVSRNVTQIRSSLSLAPTSIVLPPSMGPHSYPQCSPWLSVSTPKKIRPEWPMNQITLLGFASLEQSRFFESPNLHKHWILFFNFFCGQKPTKFWFLSQRILSTRAKASRQRYIIFKVWIVLCCVFKCHKYLCLCTAP